MSGYVKRVGLCSWSVVYPAAPGEGMDTATEGHLTRVGARLSLWWSGRRR